MAAAFAAVALIGAGAASGASYRVARDAVLEQIQDHALRDLGRQLSTNAEALTLPIDTADLGQALGGIPGDAVAEYRGMHLGDDAMLSDVSPELRTAVHNRHDLYFQRVMHGGRPMLVMGTPIMASSFTGQLEPSGIEVYAEQPLDRAAVPIRALATAAWLTTLAVLPLAVLVALLAARRVLRPVRELGATARKLGAGDLDARLRVRGTDELAQLSTTFNQTAGALQEHVDELRRMEAEARRFVADVSHELRTPLTALTAVADVLSEEAPTLRGDVAFAARLVGPEVRALNLLVNDLIEISRFDAGMARLALSNVDMAAAIAATLLLRGWSDRVRTEVPVGLSVRVDQRRLDIIVANLVGNALNHGAHPVSVVVRHESGWVEVVVSDRGPGIPHEVLPHLFDRFYKGDAARTRTVGDGVAGGSGLGLAIAWENSRLHGGSLRAENREEGGARFVLRLPFRKPADS